MEETGVDQQDVINLRKLLKPVVGMDLPDDQLTRMIKAGWITPQTLASLESAGDLMKKPIVLPEGTAKCIFKHFTGTPAAPPAIPPLPSYVGVGTEGLVSRPYFSRRADTVAALINVAAARGMLVIEAPPQSGKTSIMQLLHASASQGPHSSLFQKAIYISVAANEKDFDHKLMELGVDVSRMGGSPPSNEGGVYETRDSRPTLVLIDESQILHDQQATGSTGFWSGIKRTGAGPVPGHGVRYYFILARLFGAGMTAGAQSPFKFPPAARVTLRPGPDLGFGMLPNPSLALSMEECEELVAAFEALLEPEDGKIDREMLAYLHENCGGIAGLVTIALDAAKQRLVQVKQVPPGAFKEEQSATSALRFILRFNIMDNLAASRAVPISQTIYGSACPASDKALCFILDDNRADGSGQQGVPFGEIPGALQPKVKELCDGGVFVQHGDVPDRVDFPSHLQRLFYIVKVYRNVAAANNSSVYNGNDLQEFILHCLRLLDPETMKSSLSRHKDDGDIYERQYQMEFYKAACIALPQGVNIYPDVGKGAKDRGYIDFLIPKKGEQYGWGVELLVHSKGLSDHLKRFAPPYGAYCMLQDSSAMQDYAIIDFYTHGQFVVNSRSSGHQAQKLKLLRVCFAERFETATVTFGSAASTQTVRLRSRKEGSLAVPDMVKEEDALM